MEDTPEAFPVAPSDGRKYTMRFSDESLKATLEAIAAKNGRSLNTEINARLAASLDAPGGEGTRAYLEQEFAEIKRELARMRQLILKTQ